jgi:hypothetical protein
MANPTLQIALESLQLDEFAPGEALRTREPKIDSATGTLYIGAESGPPWQYLPATGITAPNGQLQQLIADLESLRSIAATDADLDAEIAELLATIDAIQQSAATDAEVAAELGPIRSAIALLASDDDVNQAIQAIQLSIGGLDSTFATDLQLAQAIAQVAASMPIRSALPPTAPAVGQHWIQLSADGLDIYGAHWVWAGSEWQSADRIVIGVGSGRISGNASPRLDLGLLVPRPGLAGYRLISASLRTQLEGAGSWTARLRKFKGAATIGPEDWAVFPGISATAKTSATYALALPADSLLSLAIPALELGLIKGAAANTPDSIFALTTEWVAVRT